jgi:hypothetical protein
VFSKPAVVFTDVEAWAVEYLSDALALIEDDFAADVTVTNVAPETIPARLVTVRDDSGPRSEHVTKTSSMAVNVWAASDEDASDLARLVVALLESSAGSGAVVGHESTFGPSRVPEPSGQPHWFATVDLIHRGVSL